MSVSRQNGCMPLVMSSGKMRVLIIADLCPRLPGTCTLSSGRTDAPHYRELSSASVTYIRSRGYILCSREMVACVTAAPAFDAYNVELKNFQVSESHKNDLAQSRCARHSGTVLLHIFSEAASLTYSPWRIVSP